MSIHKESDETGKRRDVSRPLPKSDTEDSFQQSSQVVWPPRHDSYHPISQDSAIERVNSSSGRADPQREGIDVSAQQMPRVAPNQYQSKPESRYRSPSQQRADMEARHKPEIQQGRQPGPISQSLQTLHGIKPPPVVSYQSSSAYPPSQQKSSDGFKESNDSQEHLRRRGADDYDVSEQEVGHLKKWKCHICKAGPHLYATTPSCTECGHQVCRDCKTDGEIPPQSGSGTFRSRESRQIAPRQPSPDTHGNQRMPAPSSEPQKHQYAKTDRATKYYR
jgi:hypothetical protein